MMGLKSDKKKRMWRNWQTRRFQVPVGNSVWVQVPSSAPTAPREGCFFVGADEGNASERINYYGFTRGASEFEGRNKGEAYRRDDALPYAAKRKRQIPFIRR